MARNIDPRAQQAVDFIRQHEADYSGSIVPKWLTAALPAQSAKRGWREDGSAVGVPVAWFDLDELEKMKDALTKEKPRHPL
jgi:hypothetical protein